MVAHVPLLGPHSMLKVDFSRTNSHHGFPRAMFQLRMCTLSLGLLLLLCCGAARGQGSGNAVTPCPSTCNCYTLSTNPSNCVVDCSNANFTTITSITDLPHANCSIVKLDLSRNNISSIEVKSSIFQYMPYLETLDLSYNHFTSLSSSSFMYVTRIQHLNISRNSITDIGANSFYSMTSLRSLDLSYNRFSTLDATSFRYMTNLQTLSLAGNLIEKFKDKSFEVASLTTLDLSENPVETFEPLMFTSSSSITTFYINKMNLTSLPSFLFTHLRQLEHLYLHGNNITYIASDAFSSNPNLTVLDASNNKIEWIDMESFHGLTTLTHLDISHNNLVTLNTTIFRDIESSLTSLNVAYNDWVCNCSMKPFIEFLVTFNDTSGRTLVDWQNTTCAEQSQGSVLELGSQFLSNCSPSVSDSQDSSEESSSDCKNPNSNSIHCRDAVRVKRDSSDSSSSSDESSSGPSDYFSCYTDDDMGTISTIVYSSNPTASSQLYCTEECFKLSLSYALFYSSSCFCGNATTDNCQCSTNHSNEDVVACTTSSGSEDKTFLSSVTFVSAGIILNTIPRLTSGVSHSFVANVNLGIINQFIWNFGDSSTYITKSVTGSSLTVSYTYSVPAKYTLNVLACYYSGPSVCESASLPVIVDPPDSHVTIKMSGSLYVGSVSTAGVTAEFAMGNDLPFSWSRSPDDGITATTNLHCDSSWTSVLGRCIQLSGSAMTYNACAASCSSSNNSMLNSIQHSSEVTEFANIIDMSSSVSPVFIDAKKDGSFYKWSDGSDTYFTTADVTSSGAGDCVVIDINTMSLMGADCSSSQYCGCQQAPTDACPYGGVYYPDTMSCYKYISTSATWAAASTACQNLTTDASLAIFNSDALVSHVTSNILISGTEAWVGLSDQQMEGYLLWVNDESVSSYSPMSSIPSGDCFSLNSAGTWNGNTCTTTLPYICQYSVLKEKVNVQASAAGTMDLNPTAGSYNLSSLAASSTPAPAGGVATLFPGYWISEDSATIRAWNIKTANLTTSQVLAFQVYRPECKAGETLVAAGCNGNGARFASCKTSATTCPTVRTCSEGYKYCFLDDSCKPVRDPCDCNAISAAGCSEPYIESSPSYRLVGQTFVDIQAGPPQYYTILSDEIDVQRYDIIGYQSNTGNDVIFCETGGNWSQNAEQSNVGNWLSANDLFNISSWKNNTMCYVNAIYSKSVSKSIPSSLSYFTETGSYQYSLNTEDPAVTKTRTLTVQEIVGQPTLLWPLLQVGQSTDTIFLESGVSTDMVIVTDFGTSLSATWSIGSSSTQQTTFSNTCPSNASALCSAYTNWPDSPFTNITQSFAAGTTEVHVAVANQVSSANVSVTVRAFDVISGLSIALNTAQGGNNYVAYNEQSSFTVTATTGSPGNYKYYVNGSLEYTANSATFSHTFDNVTIPYHVVRVNASDDYSYQEAEVSVFVKVRANFQNFQFTNVPSVLEVNTLYEYGSSVEANVGAEVSIMWIFGAGPPELVTMTTTSATQVFNHNYTYTTTGYFSLAIFLQDDSFLSAKYISNPVDVVKKIPSVSVSASSQVIQVGDSVTFTATLPGPDYYGRTIYYTFDFQDGTTSVNQTTTLVTHTFNTASSPVYQVSLVAMNGISSASGTVEITVEEHISGLSLTGTSPILINTMYTYIASVSQGTHLTYQFQEPTLGVSSPFTDGNTYNLTVALVGVYNLTVTANNTFSTYSESMEVRAVNISTLQILSFTHDRYVATNTAVTFKLDVLNLNVASLHCVWNYDDGNSDTGNGLTETSHTYSTPNNYTVTVTLIDNSTGVQTTQTSEIGVQDLLSNFSVTVGGTGNIVSGAAGTVVLTASISTGTDIWYTYTYNSASYSTTSSTYKLIHSTAEVLTVSAMAANQLGSKNYTVSVTFQESIESLTISCAACTVNSGMYYLATNESTTYTANVSVGTNVSYSFVVAGSSEVAGQTFPHAFTVKGTDYINVTASNLVSSSTASLPMTVQDTISDLQFTTTDFHILVNSTLTMETTVTGSDVTYDWKLCSSCSLITVSSGTYTNPGYTASGSYTVTVVARNEISSATVSVAILVHDEVTDASITSPDLVSGTYATINQSITFNPSANIDLHVHYDWKIFYSNGTMLTTKFNFNPFRHTFVGEGTFIVQATAINGAGQKEVNITVIVETPISGVTIGNNASSPIATLSGLSLTVSVTHGSTLSYSWVRNTTTLSETSTNLNLAFSPSGNYRISVVVTNPLGSVTQTIDYLVLDEVENATIVPPSTLTAFPFVAINTAAQFSASVAKGDEYSVEWKMSQTSLLLTGSLTTFDFTFTSVANYTLEMNVSNAVSYMVKSTIISIQTPLTSLTVTSSHSAAKTNESVTFTANHNSDADHLNYKWTIDSTTTTTSSNTNSYTFTTAGSYTVVLEVGNEISNMTATVTVIIQDEIKGLTITGCNSTVNVTVEAQAVATLTEGTDASYDWSVVIGSNSEKQTTSNFVYAFVNTGIYDISLNVSNLVSHVISECSFTVIGPISDLVISMPESRYLFVNYTIDFTVTGTNLIGVTYVWNFSPTSDTSTTTSGSLAKVFTISQDYVLTLTVYNDIDTEVITQPFFIDELSCTSPAITPGGVTSKSGYKSKSAVFEVYIDRSGCVNYNLEYQWTAYNVTNCAETLANPVTFTNVPVNTPKLSLPNGTLDYGQYCIELVATYTGTPLEETVKFNMTVMKTDLVAVLSGGSVTEVPANSWVRLDGSDSYDPDHSSSIQYSWACTKDSGSGAKDACGSVSGSSNSVINITASELAVGDEYSVTLTVSAMYRTSGTFTQKLLVGADDIPSVSVECLSCNARDLSTISSGSQLVLGGSCSNCGSATVTYQWTASYTQSGSSIAFTLDSSSTKTGDSAANLVIKSGALVDGYPYTFRLTVTKTLNSVTTSAYAELNLSSNTPPTGSGCTVSNTAVVAFETLSFNCQGFSDPDSSSTELTYKVVAYSTDTASSGQSVVIYYGTKSIMDIYLTSWSGASRSTVQLKIFVIDSFSGMFEGLDQLIAVTMPTLTGQTMTEYLWEKANGEMIGLIKENSPTLLLQYAITMLHELNEQSRVASSSDTEKYMRASLRNILSLTVLGLPLESTEEQEQLAFLMDHLTVYEEEYQTSACQNLLLTHVSSLKSSMEAGVRQGLEQSEVLTDHLLGAVANVMSGVNLAVYSSSASLVSGWFNVTMEMYIPSVSSLVNVFSSNSLSGEEHRKSVVTSGFSQVEDIVSLNLKAHVLGQEGLSFTLNTMDIYGVRRTSDNLNLDYVGGNSGILIASDIADNYAAGTELFQIYINSDQSPFTWGYTSGFGIDTKMASLSLKDTSGSTISISGLSDSSRVKLALIDTDEQINVTQASFIGNSGYDQTKNLPYIYTTVDSSSPKLITLDPSTGVDGSAVYIQIGAKNVDDATADAIASPSLISFYLGIDIASPSESDNHDSIQLVAGDTLPSDHRNHTFYINNFDSSKTYRISVYNNDTDKINVSAAVYMASCMYYDTSEFAWSTSGCEATDETIATGVVCSCNHLTAFGGGMLVPINAISFSDLEFIDLYTNPVVFVTCAIIFVIYIVVAIISRRLDLRDLERISFIPLCGKEGSFKYEITIVTGKQSGAGTSAHVGIKLYGEYGKSGRKLLSKKGAFQRNCQDSFIIAHDTNLGNISKIFIWHDNHGLDPSWYMVQVIVRDLQTEQNYYFFGNVWLTLEVEKGVIQKELYAAGSEEIQQFTRIFGHALSSSVSDRHLWMSILDRPANSRFTRVQRATCIVTILYVFMCINAIWYGILKTQNSDSSTTSFGWQEVVVALATNAVVFPFSIILISIFKKSRSRNNVFEQGIRSGTAETIEIDNNCDQSMYSSFQTNEDLVSYLGDRESTTDSIMVPPAAPSKSLALRRTKTMKHTQKGIEKMPSSDSFTSSISSDKNDGKLQRTNNPGTWDRDKFTESWQSRLNPARSASASVGREEPQPSTSSDRKMDKAAIKAEVKDAADDIMHYLDLLETDMINKEKMLQKQKDPNHVTPGLLRKPPIRRSTASGSGIRPEGSEPSNQNKKADVPRKGGLKRNDSTQSVGLSAVSSSSYAVPSSSGSGRNFTPREEASISEKKPPSANSLKNFVSKLKHSGSSRSSAMPSVEHTDMLSVQPLQPDSMLARQISQPDIITHDVRSFSMDGGDIRKKKTGCTLPPWCVYVGYFLCFCLSVLSVIVVMLYGYQFGAEVALQWVLALLFSIMFSFFVFEFFKAVFMALYIAGIEKKADPYDENDVIDIEPIIDNSVETVKEMKFKPLAGFSLVKAKEEGQKVQRMRLMLRQFVAYTFYLWLLMVLCYVNFNTSQYYFTYHTENQFVKTVVSNNTYSFQNMTSVADFWVWSQDVLSGTLHGEEINNNFEYSIPLGPARLRQVRSLTETCIAYESLVTLGSASFLSGKTCVGSDGYEEDQNNYGETWSVYQTQNQSWPYYTSDQTGSKSRHGAVFSYSGGGYIQFLGTSYNESLTILQDLQAKDWINLQTRAVFVDFTLYNPATDLTTFVNLLVEFPLTGYVNTSHEIQSQKLLRYITDVVDPLLVCEAILFVVVAYLWIHLVLLIRDQGCSFFTSAWNLYELLTTFMAVAVISLYVGCVVVATSTFDNFLADTNSYTNFETTVDIHVSMRYMQACLLFLLMFKVVKQLRFIKILHIYEKTLSESFGKLMGVALIFAILFLTHGMVAYLWYGAYIGGFENYWTTLTSLVGMIRGTFDFWTLLDNQPIFTHFFFYSFYIFVYGLTIGLIVAILSDTYSTLHSQMFFKATLDLQDHEMIDFAMKRFKLWAGFTKPKPEFRSVRFPGLPSVSSRCTSSSSTRSFTDGSISSDGLGSEIITNPGLAAARLSSTWTDVLHTMDRVSHLDSVEEDLIKKCQKEVEEWKWQSRISSLEKENDGLLNWTKKPPQVPNTRTTKIPKRITSQPCSTARSEGTAKTPPSKPTIKEKPMTKITRPLSDQGGRAGPKANQPGPSQDRKSVLDFFKSIKPSKPAW